MKKTFTIILLSTFFCAANAQFYQQSPKLTASGQPAQSEFGNAVALSTDASTAIVGEWGGTNGAVGAAIIYDRSNSVWTQGSVLIGTGATGGANQGYSVALSTDGNTAVVGGPTDDGGVGAVWVFTRTGGTWSQQGTKLVGTGSTGNSYQGYKVAISGDGNTILAGAPGDNNNLGAAWVFTRSGNTWSQQGTKLIGSGAGNSSGGAEQGSAVALSNDGNTAIICGDHDFDNYQRGAVWIFKRNSNSWTQQGAKLYLTSGASSSLGTAAALSADGNTAIIGAASDNSNTGAAYVITYNGSGWVSQGSALIGTFPVGNAQQGGSVGISADGKTAVVGGGASTFSANSGDIGVGAVWVFKYNGSNWIQDGAKYVGTGNIGNCQQGQSVALSADGNTFMTGGFADNADQGAVWVFSQTLPINTSVASLSANTDIFIYPNPATNILNVKMPGINRKIIFEITDILGRKQYSARFDGLLHQHQIDITMLVPGLYTLNAIIENETPKQIKFVKQ